MKTLLNLLAVLSLALGAAAATFSDALFLTSAGQSNDVLIAKQIFLRAGLEDPRMDARAMPDTLEGVETLVMVVGGSSKGLGNAKDSVELEMARLDSLLAYSQEQSIPVVCMHLGRKTRRGPLSDGFIEKVAASSSTLLVVDGGNHDGYFSEISREKEIPLIEVADYVEMVDQVNQLFGLKKP